MVWALTVLTACTRSPTSYTAPRFFPCTKTSRDSQPTLRKGSLLQRTQLGLAFQWKAWTDFQLINLSTDGFLIAYLPPQRALLFFFRVMCCMLYHLQLPSTACNSQGWPRADEAFNSRDCVPQSARGQHVFSANLGTAFQQSVVFPIVAKYIRALFLWEELHT